MTTDQKCISNQRLQNSDFQGHFSVLKIISMFSKIISTEYLLELTTFITNFFDSFDFQITYQKMPPIFVWTFWLQYQIQINWIQCTVPCCTLVLIPKLKLKSLTESRLQCGFMYLPAYRFAKFLFLKVHSLGGLLVTWVVIPIAEAV